MNTIVTLNDMMTVQLLSTRSLYYTLPVALLVMGYAASSPAVAQTPGKAGDETLIGRVNVRSSGGYGASAVALTTLNGTTTAMIGGQGGWVLNRRFVIGGAIRGIAPHPSVDLQNVPQTAPESAQLQLGYGGLLLEYIGAPSNLLHYGAELVVGGGTINLLDNAGFQAGASVPEESIERSAVFATELGARAELNITHFFRVGLGGGYRLIRGAGLEKTDMSNSDLSAPYGQLSLRFGSF